MIKADQIKKLLFLVMLFGGIVTLTNGTQAANYPLEIIQPQPDLTTNSRYYRAYPGLEYEVPIGVFGGDYPFEYLLVAAPAGMTIDSSSGIISWPNPTTDGSPHNITVSVTDSENTTVTRSWTLTVTSSGFIFVDASAGEGGDGSISNPFNSMVDFYGGTDYDALHDTTYAGYFVYWRSGTYAVEGYEANTGQQAYVGYPMAEHPHVWLAYPGETVTIDHSANEGRFLNTSSWTGQYDMYVGGIRFYGALNHFWRTGGQRTVFYDCEFDTWGPGEDGANSSALMWASSGGINGHYYPFIKDCTFVGMDTGTGNCFIKLYSTTKMAIADSSFSGVIGESAEGIAIKANSMYTDVRNNRITCPNHCLNGNWNNCGEIEVRHNLVLGADATYDGDGDPGALTINHDGLAGRAYIHRNTFQGNILEKYSDVGDGPFDFYANVIVNENEGDNPVGSHINGYGVISSGLNLSNNLACYAVDGCVDSNGQLQGSYRTQYLGIRGFELGTEETDTRPPVVPGGLEVR